MSDSSLRVATFNIHHGQGTDGVTDIGRTADVIKELDADMIALQELDAGTRRSRNVDQPAELADRLGMHVYFAPTVSMAPGEYGIALASRNDFEGVVERLPRRAQEEPRVAIVASWHQIAIVATHLSRDTAARKLQTEHLADVAGKLGSPAMVLGDLNQSESKLEPLTRSGFVAVRAKPTAWNRFKRRPQIDHILTTRELRVSGQRLVETAVSDHPVLLAELHSDHA